MSFLRVRHLPEFYFGDDAVVVVMDARASTPLPRRSFRQALAQGDCRTRYRSHTHRVQVKPGTADIGLHDARVHWQLDHATVMGMIDKLSGLKDGNSAHHYVDIASPAKTLVLSLNEYVDAPWLDDPQSMGPISY